MLKAYVASLEEVDEKFRSLYVQSGTGFKLNVTGIDTHPEVIGLKQNRDQLLTEKKTATDALKPFSDLGKTPEEITAAMAVAADVATGKLVKDGKVDEAVTAEKTRAQQALDALKKNHTAELTKRDEREQFLMGSIKKRVHEAAVREAIKAEDGIEALLFDKLMRETDMVEIGEADQRDFVVRVKDDAGSHRYADSVGSFLTAQQRVKELRADVENFGGAFRANKSKGSGANPHQKPTQPGGGTEQAQKTGHSKIMAGLQALGGDAAS